MMPIIAPRAHKCVGYAFVDFVLMEWTYEARRAPKVTQVMQREYPSAIAELVE
jgi:hypothetical protein